MCDEKDVDVLLGCAIIIMEHPFAGDVISETSSCQEGKVDVSETVLRVDELSYIWKDRSGIDGPYFQT